MPSLVESDTRSGSWEEYLEITSAFEFSTLTEEQNQFPWFYICLVVFYAKVDWDWLSGSREKNIPKCIVLLATLGAL